MLHNKILRKKKALKENACGQGSGAERDVTTTDIARSKSWGGGGGFANKRVRSVVTKKGISLGSRGRGGKGG